MIRFFVLLLVSLSFAPSALADGGTTTVDLSPDLLTTSKTKLDISTEFGTFQVRASELRKLMDTRANKSASAEILAGLSVTDDGFIIQQSQRINLIGLPAGYSADLLTWTYGDFSKALNPTSRTVKASSVRTRHLLAIDCNCE